MHKVSLFTTMEALSFMYTPQFIINNEILTNIGIIEGAREMILNAPLLPSFEKQFREEAIVRTVHHGTHIEGNALNFTEAQQVLQGKPVVGRDRDIQEVLNYRSVLRFLENIAHEESTKEVITEDIVKKIHAITTDQILPKEQCGIYRTTQVVVKNAATGEITFRPPPAVEVPFHMEDFLLWLASADAVAQHPVLRAAIVHYELVRIHPFVDGNGRTARATATLVLFLARYDIKKFFALEEYFDKDAASYYQALQSAESGNLTAWLSYFTKGLSIELTRIKEKIKRLSTDIHLKEKLGGKQIFLSDRQVTIIEYIQRVGYLQNQNFPDIFPKISEDTVLRDLKDLLEKGLIKKTGSTKGARYVLR